MIPQFSKKWALKLDHSENFLKNINSDEYAGNIIFHPQ